MISLFKNLSKGPHRQFLIFIFFVAVLHGQERYLGVVTKYDYKGETSLAYRIQAACKNIGWKADIIDVENLRVVENRTYDFVINLTPFHYRHTKCKNFQAIFHPKHHYFDDKGFLLKRYWLYNGYLLTYLPGTSGIHEKNFKHKRKFPFMNWLPTVQKMEYKKVNPQFLFHTCCSWGNRFEEVRFKELLTLLNREPYTRFYGLTIFKKLYPESYQTFLPYEDGSLYRTLSDCGVCLVIHSAEHNEYGLPSGRIFEAAAASTVIICDENAFVKNHFGDSVFYINTSADAYRIFEQIQNLMKWIFENKELALEKAKRVHAICEEKFLLENQLLNLEKFYIERAR